MTRAAPRVLLVDDEADFVANLVDILVDAGFQVDSTTEPTQAVQLARENIYDAAILDWRMPGLDGVRLQGMLREHQQDLATILLTAYADDETHRAARQAGFWSILEKPCDVPKIQTLLHGVTRRPRLLVVDDEAEFGKGLVEVLHQNCVRAAYCTTVRQAMERVEQSDWDVVLLDLMLPNESPQDLVELLSCKGERTSIILLTGQSRSEVEGQWRRFQELGVDVLLHKPLDVAGLLARFPEEDSSESGPT